jgi:Na+-driven multidrug efflux pump
MVRVFSADDQVVAIGAEYLRIISWTFVCSGVIFVASSMFQAMGHTLPALATSFVRIIVVSVPVLLLSRQPGFALRWIWYLSAASIAFQMVLSLLLLRREFGRRLKFEPVPAPAIPVG